MLVANHMGTERPVLLQRINLHDYPPTVDIVQYSPDRACQGGNDHSPPFIFICIFTISTGIEAHLNLIQAETITISNSLRFCKRSVIAIVYGVPNSRRLEYPPHFIVECRCLCHRYLLLKLSLVDDVRR